MRSALKRRGLRGGVAPWRDGQPIAGANRVSGYAARSAGACRSFDHHGAAGFCCYLDSRPTRLARSSCTLAPRGVAIAPDYTAAESPEAAEAAEEESDAEDGTSVSVVADAAVAR